MQRARRWPLWAALGSLALAGSAGASDGAPAARVTAVSGTAHAGDAAAFEPRAELADDGRVVTEDGSNCSVLVDEDALVELCAGTSLQLTRRPDTGQRVVRVDSGHVRLVVEKRAAAERIEIHTPAAIATILGSIVFVEVDPKTGRTTISSSESDVRIQRAADPDDGDFTIVGAQQQVTLDKDGPLPAVPERITREVLSNLTGCLVDFHNVAISADRASSATRAAERVAVADAAAVDLQDVAAAADEGLGDIDDPDDLGDPLEPTDSIDVDKYLGRDDDLPGCAAGVLQEGCAF